MLQPSPSELEILKILWRRSPLSAREISEQLKQHKSWSRSTVRTLITRMVDKQLISQKDSHGLALFSTGVSKTVVMTSMIKSFSAQVFDLDRPIGISAFADSPLLDEVDIEEIEALLKKDSKK